MRKVAVLCIFAFACGKGSTSENKVLTTSNDGTKIQVGSNVALARAKAEFRRKIHQLEANAVQAGWNLMVGFFAEDKPETLNCLALLLGRQPIATVKQIVLDSRFEHEANSIRVNVDSSFRDVIAFIEKHKSEQLVEVVTAEEESASLEAVARGRGWNIRRSMFLSRADYILCLQKILTIDTPVDTGEVDIVADSSNFMVLPNAILINCRASAEDIVEYLTE